MPAGVIEIDLDKLVWVGGAEGHLGQGAQGNVFKGRLRAGSKAIAVAIKSVDVNDAALREVSVLAKLQHHFIAHLYGIALSSDVGREKMLVVIEYCSLGDLGEGTKLFVADPGSSSQEQRAAKVLETLGGNRLALAGPALVIEARRRLAEKLGGALGAGANEAFYRVAVAVASALEYMHAQSIIHGDMKPSNVLLDAQGDARVADFGLSKSAAAGSSMMTLTGMGVGTPQYMPPEIIQGGRVSSPGDVYSLICLFITIHTGAVPFAGKGDNIAAIFQAIVSGERPTFSAGAPLGLVRLGVQSLDADPKRRPTARRVGFELESLQRGEEVFGAVGGQALGPIADGSFRALLDTAGLGKFAEKLEEQGFEDGGDFQNFSDAELDDVGRGAGMGIAHLKRFMKLAQVQKE